MRYLGGLPTGLGNDAAIAAGNPLLDPRFKIQGGEPWNKTPLLPGKDTEQYEQQQFNIPFQPQLPGAGIGNVGGLIAQQPQNNSQDISGFEKLLEGLEEQYQYDQLMEQFRNRAFPPTHIPAGFDGKYVSWAASI